MSIDRFSQNALRVMFSAQSEAHKLGHSTIGCEHLLLGLFANRAEVASNVLKRHNLYKRDLRRAVGEISPRNTSHTIDSGNWATKLLVLAQQESRINYSDDVTKVFKHLATLVDRLDAEVIEPGHLLVSIIQVSDDKSVLFRALGTCHVTPADLKKGAIKEFGIVDPSR